MMAAIPTPPQPNTTTDEPGFTLAVLMAAPTPVVTPQPMSEAISKGMSSSILMAASWGTVMYSAKVPVPAMPNTSSPLRVNRGVPAMENWIITHRCGDLRSVQLMHFPHGGDQATMTWSPTARSVTPSPTAEISPAPSWPGTNGAPWGRVPFMAERSEWQTPVALMWIVTSPGPGSPTSMSSTISSFSSPVLWSRAAFMAGSSGKERVGRGDPSGTRSRAVGPWSGVVRPRNENVF